MENNIDKLHIEFFGLPGSGKSTIAHELAKKLEKENTKIKEPTYIISHRYSVVRRVMVKVAMSLFLFFRNPKKMWRIIKITHKNSIFGIQRIKFILNLSHKVAIYNFGRKKSIYIWDEGLIQSAISLSLFNNRIKENVEDLLGLVNLEKIKVVFIRIKCSSNICLKRMDMREIHGSRIEKTDNKSNKKHLINSFSERCNNIVLNNLSNYDSEKQNVEFIVSEIIKNLM